MIILNNSVEHTRISPAKGLEDFIEHYFVVSLKKDLTLSKLDYSVPPRAHTVLLIKKNEATETSQVLVIGPHLQTLKRSMSANAKWFIAVLNPGASTSLFDLPGAALKNQAFDLEALKPEICKKIKSAFIPHFDAKTLDSILLSTNPVLKVNHKIPAAIALLSNPVRPLKVSEVAKELSITTRQLQREFIKWVGVSPKQFQTIQRLRSILNYAFGYQDQNWTQIAAKSGYFDQPHLNKDVGTVLALRPTEIRR